MLNKCYLLVLLYYYYLQHHHHHLDHHHHYLIICWRAGTMAYRYFLSPDLWELTIAKYLWMVIVEIWG